MIALSLLRQTSVDQLALTKWNCLTVMTNVFIVCVWFCAHVTLFLDPLSRSLQNRATLRYGQDPCFKKPVHSLHGVDELSRNVLNFDIVLTLFCALTHGFGALLLMRRVTPTHPEALKISQTSLCALETPTYTLDGGFALESQISVKLHASFSNASLPRRLFLICPFAMNGALIRYQLHSWTRLGSQIIVFVYSRLAKRILEDSLAAFLRTRSCVR